MSPSTVHSAAENAPLPPRVRLAIGGRALVKSVRERRTKRALFFTLASLMVGFTVAGLSGVLVCGFFGGSLYIVVLVLRMQRHLRAGAIAYRMANSNATQDEG